MRISLALSGILAVMMMTSGCSSTRLTVERVGTLPLVPGAASSTSGSFWESMESLDFEFVRTHACNPDQQAFAAALVAIVGGKPDTALAIVRTLTRSSGDSLIRRHARTVLSSLLFSGSRWGELLALPSTSAGDSIDDPLVTAFRGCESEEYQFPDLPVSLPMTVSTAGAPVIEVEVNGYKKMFWLDTGAGLTVLASDVAEECKVPPISQETVKASTGTTKRVDASPANIGTLNIGGITIMHHPAIILRKEDLEFKLFGLFSLVKIDGIIGWNALKHLAVDLDYSRKLVTLRRGVSSFTGERNFFWLGFPIVRVHTAEGRALHFGLDTGGKTSSIRSVIFGKVGTQEPGNTTGVIGSAGGIEGAEFKVLPTLSILLKDVRLNFGKIKTHPGDPSSFVAMDGMLGNDIAQGRILSIDFSNGIVSVALPSPAVK